MTLRIVLLSMIMAALTACGKGGDAAGKGGSTVEPYDIYVYGDEITMGQGVTTSYVDRIANRTGQRVRNMIEERYSFIDHSKPIGLDIATDTSPTFWPQALSSKDVVILFVGWQDVRRFGASLSYPSIGLYLEPFLTKVRDSGARLYVVNPIRMWAASYATNFGGIYSSSRAGTDARMAQYSTYLQTALSNVPSNRFEFVDVQSQFEPMDVSHWQSDMHYPSEKSHEFIANVILTKMGF